jgi:hypothetical protein
LWRNYSLPKKSYNNLKLASKEFIESDDKIYGLKRFSLPVAGRALPTLNWHLARMLNVTQNTEVVS